MRGPNAHKFRPTPKGFKEYITGETGEGEPTVHDAMFKFNLGHRSCRRMFIDLGVEPRVRRRGRPTGPQEAPVAEKEDAVVGPSMRKLPLGGLHIVIPTLPEDIELSFLMMRNLKGGPTKKPGVKRGK